MVLRVFWTAAAVAAAAAWGEAVGTVPGVAAAVGAWGAAATC